MLYQVPQFIDVEDKIVGPLTMRQLFILAGLGLGLFVLYFIFEPWLFGGIAVVVAAIALGLMFGKIQGRPIINVIGSIFRYYLNPRLYLWKRGQEMTAGAGAGGGIAKSKLQDLTSQLDIGGTEEES